MAAVALGGRSSSAVRLLGEGQFSVAVLLEPNTVIRFPRHAVGVKSLTWERQLVGLLVGRVSVALPEPRKARLDVEPPLAFAAHLLVPGTVVTGPTLRFLPMEELATQLGEFLDDLAALTDDALDGGGRSQTLEDVAQGLSDDVDQFLADRLTPTQQGRARREIEGLAEADRGSRALCHTDLGGNLVWDAERRRLGVIDFGDALVSDPVLDLASLAALDHELAVMVGSRSSHLRDREADIAAIHATFALQDALNSARQRQWDQVDEVLAEY